MRNDGVLFCFTLLLCLFSFTHDTVLTEVAVGASSSSSWLECAGPPVLSWLSVPQSEFYILKKVATKMTWWICYDFFFNKFASVGKLSVDAFHKKCLILPGTLSFQILDHKPDLHFCLNPKLLHSLLHHIKSYSPILPSRCHFFPKTSRKNLIVVMHIRE